MILVSHIIPFDAKQKIYVLTENRRDTEEMRLTSLEKFSDTVMQLITEYGVTSLELYGNKELCEKEAKAITEAELLKYKNNQLKIEIKGAV